MPDHQKIITAISSFINGGDTSDIKMLKDVLHKDFRVSSNNFMGSPGVMLISREQYLSNIQTGVFGGVPRKISIESIDQNDSIAMVKLRLESSENHFVSYNLLVLDTDGCWKVIDNLAVVEAREVVRG